MQQPSAGHQGNLASFKQDVMDAKKPGEPG
jgi:hypothetical protein